MAENKGPDAGWNDPPTFTYDRATEIQNNAMKKGNLLKKRVAYPMSGIASTLPCGIDPTTPPQSKGINIIGPPPLSLTHVTPLSCSAIKPSADEPPENALEEVMEIFNNKVNGINDEHKEEISKRIIAMEKLWIDKKLNADIHKKLYDLSKALKNGDLTTADRLQKSLSVDHIGICSTWMGGIRQLINLLREINQNESSS